MTTYEAGYGDAYSHLHYMLTEHGLSEMVADIQQHFDTENALPEHDRRVQVKALRDAAEAAGNANSGNWLDVWWLNSFVEEWLGERADAIERGEGLTGGVGSI